jgi:hypothetical protein
LAIIASVNAEGMTSMTGTVTTIGAQAADLQL